MPGPMSDRRQILYSERTGEVVGTKILVPPHGHAGDRVVRGKTAMKRAGVPSVKCSQHR